MCRDDRYILVVYPFIFMITALLLERLISSTWKIWKIISLCTILLVIILNSYGALSAMSSKYAGYSLKARGYSYLAFIGWKSDITPFLLPEYIHMADNLETSAGNDLIRSFCDTVALSLQDIDKLFLMTRKVKLAYRAPLYRRLGNEIGRRLTQNDGISLQQVQHFINYAAPLYRKDIYRGLLDGAIWGAPEISSRLSIAERIISQAGEQYYPYSYCAIGRSSQEDYLEITSPTDRQYAYYFYEGIGCKIINDYLLATESSADPNFRLASINKRYRSSVLFGIGEQMRLFVNQDPANMLVWNRLWESLPDESSRNYCREGFRRKQSDGMLDDGF